MIGRKPDGIIFQTVMNKQYAKDRVRDSKAVSLTVSLAFYQANL